MHLGNETSEFQVALICRERQAGTGVKGSQIDDEEPREEKEEKDWKIRPIAFQVLYINQVYSSLMRVRKFRITCSCRFINKFLIRTLKLKRLLRRFGPATEKTRR